MSLYPAWRYHISAPAKLIASEADEHPDWKDTPAAFLKTAPPEAPVADPTVEAVRVGSTPMAAMPVVDAMDAELLSTAKALWALPWDKVIEQVRTSEDVALLTSWLDLEPRNPKNRGGRRSVVAALHERLAVLPRDA